MGTAPSSWLICAWVSVAGLLRLAAAVENRSGSDSAGHSVELRAAARPRGSRSALSSEFS